MSSPSPTTAQGQFAAVNCAQLGVTIWFTRGREAGGIDDGVDEAAAALRGEQLLELRGEYILRGADAWWNYYAVPRRRRRRRDGL